MNPLKGIGADSDDSAQPGTHLVSDRADRPCSALYVVGWKIENQITNDRTNRE